MNYTSRSLRRRGKTNKWEAAIFAGCFVIFLALVVIFCVHGCDSSLRSAEESTCDSAELSVAEGGQHSANDNAKELSSPEQATGQSALLETSEKRSGINHPAQGESTSSTESGFSNQAANQSSSSRQTTRGAGSTESINMGATSNDMPSSDSSSTPQKRWVTDYENVWVEDAAAWTEQVPIYGYEEHSICNICGADITGCEVSHGKQHMLAGGGSGHHTEPVQAVVGYSIVEHTAQGHWETIESGGHWE